MPSSRVGSPLSRHCLHLTVPEAGRQAPPLQTTRPGRAHTGRRSAGVCGSYHRNLPGGSLQAELLTLNESLVLLSGCLQMMIVTREQRRTDPASIKIAHNSPFVRASFPSTATMQKVMIRIAKEEGGREGCNSIFFQIPTDTLSLPQNPWRGRLRFCRHQLP